MKKLWILLAAFSLFSSLSLAANEPKPVPDFKVTDQNGKTFQLHELKGSYLLMSFVFTRCPMADMCPLTMKLSRDLIEKWKAQSSLVREGFPLKIVAVTLDPEYDTPVVLKKYVEQQGMDPEHFLFLTGEPKVLSDLASEFNVIGIPNGGTISHNVKTALLNPLMVPLQEYKDNQWTPEQVLSVMRKSVAWWKWFFIASALLAIPGMLLLLRLRRYKLDAPLSA